MKPIQLLLLLTPISALFFIRSRRSYLTRVFTRIGFIIVSLGFAFMIFYPSLVIDAANLLGVGRGTDLIVYLLAMCFFLLCVLIFIKVKDLENKIVMLVRELSITTSEKNHENQ